MKIFASSVVVASALVLVASCADQANPSFPTLPDADVDAEVEGPIVGDPNKGVLLEGTIVGESGPFDGQILALPNGTIGCIEPGTACSSDPASAGAATFKIDGIIAPGLIDTHNHILFDIFNGDDWLPSRKYQHHDEWTRNTNEPRYTVMVDVKQCLEDASQGKPTWCPTKYDGTGNLRCEMEKWGEIKALISGTTSVVGLAGTAFPCYASLARSIDTQFNGFDADKIQTAAILPSKATADGACGNYADGSTTAYLMHVGEGLNEAAREEFDELGALTTTPQCLFAPQTVITHGTAFTNAEWDTMTSKGMKLTWSPASNIALYGETTNIPAALDKNILVSLGPDWSMGGSQNMLDELRFAKGWSDSKWSGRLSAKDVVTMATVNGATVLGLADKLGVLKKGHMADLFVVRGDKSAPYDAILAATPREVRLTMVGGKVLYGDAPLKALATLGPACEDFDACGEAKFLCVAEPGQPDKRDQSYAVIKGLLDAAMTDLDAVRPREIGGNFSPIAPAVACGAK